MSFDHLHSKIKAKKCPICATIAPLSGGDIDASKAFCQKVFVAVSPIVPAVRFPLLSFAALGQKGLGLLEDLLQKARKDKLFTILDAGTIGAEDAKRLLSQPFEPDCLLVSGYPGGPDLSSLLDLCQQEDKCLFLQARTAQGGDLQDLVAGDRLVYQVVGDLAQRLGAKGLGNLGYSRAGILLEGVYPSDLRNLRKRWETEFFLVSGPAEDARFAFDKYGRGAMVLLPAPSSPEEAKIAAENTRDELKNFVTVL